MPKKACVYFLSCLLGLLQTSWVSSLSTQGGMYWHLVTPSWASANFFAFFFALWRLLVPPSWTPADFLVKKSTQDKEGTQEGRTRRLGKVKKAAKELAEAQEGRARSLQKDKKVAKKLVETQEGMTRSQGRPQTSWFAFRLLLGLCLLGF